jgi:hypothetical protein
MANISANERARLSIIEQKSIDSTNLLIGAHKTLDRTDLISVSIMENLHQQGETIVRIKGRVDTVNSNIVTGRRTISDMIRRNKNEIYIIAFLIALLIVLIVLISYYVNKNK